MPVATAYIAKAAAEAGNEPPALSPLLIPQEEACRVLGGISRRHLFTLRTTAGLPVVSIGGRLMVDPIDLRKWIDDRKKPAALSIHQDPDDAPVCSD